MSSPKGYPAGPRGRKNEKPSSRTLLEFISCGIGALPAFGCGGTQASSPIDASDETTVSPALAPNAPAACAASKSYVFQPLVGFDDTDVPQTIGGRVGNQLAGTFTTFVSFDLSGNLFDDFDQLVVPHGCTTGWQPLLGPGNAGALSPSLRCGSDSQALHIHATGVDDAGAGLSNWGLNVGVDLRQNCNCDSTMTAGDPPSCAQRGHPELGCVDYCSLKQAHCFFDATGWTGISFWALSGPSTTGTTALMTLTDPNTAGQAGGNDPAHQEAAYPFNRLLCGNPPCVANTEDGGVIDAGMACTSTSAPACLCDPFGKAVGLTNHWEFYAIPFGELRQKGYGRAETALDLAHVVGFKMSFGRGVWDVWLDDIAFYKPKAP